MSSKDTPGFQYAHIIPQKLVGLSIVDINAFALCGNNGGDKRCHAAFDKIIKPALQRLSDDPTQAWMWISGARNLFEGTPHQAAEILVRAKIRMLINWQHPTSPRWPKLTGVELLRALIY